MTVPNSVTGSTPSSMTIVTLADGEAMLLTEQGVHYTVRIEKGKHEEDHIKMKWKIQVPNV
jgi:hypothetical protein